MANPEKQLVAKQTLDKVNNNSRHEVVSESQGSLSNLKAEIKRNKEKKTYPIMSPEAFEQVKEYQSSLLDIYKEERSKIESEISDLAISGKTRLGTQAVERLSRHMGNTLKGIFKQATVEINVVLDKNNNGEISETEALRQIVLIKESIGEKLVQTRIVLELNARNEAAQGSNGEKIDYVDMARMDKASDATAKLLLSKDKKLFNAFKDVLENKSDVSKHFKIISSYLEGAQSQFAWTIIKQMNTSDKEAFTKYQIEAGVDVDGYFKAGISQGVYAPTEVLAFLPDFYKNNPEQMKEDEEKYNAITELQDKVKGLANYTELTADSIGRKLSPAGILKFIAKIWAGVTVGSNIIVNAFAKTGKFSLKDAVVNGVLKNPYTLGAAGGLYAANRLENDKPILPGKENDKGLKGGAYNKFSQLRKNSKIGKFLTMTDSNDKNKRNIGSEAMAAYVHDMKDTFGKKSLSMNNFSMWLYKHKTRDGKMIYPDVYDNVMDNNNPEKKWIDDKDFKALANVYYDMELSNAEARKDSFINKERKN